MAMTDTTARTVRPLSRPASTNPFRVYWAYAINVVIIHILALLALVPWFFSWTGLAACVLGLYVFGTLGINLAFHRLLTHRSLTLPKWLEYSLSTLAVCCLQDSPARWVAIHRLHHQHSDDEFDPHSPLVSFLWGHVGWVVVRNASHDGTIHYEHYCRDILRDPYYFWIERNLRWFWMYVVHAVLFFLAGLAIGTATTGDWQLGVQFGASLLVWGVLLRTVLVWHITWTVNSLAHVFGYQNYQTGDSSRNNLLCALISNGEGWHNNHHAFQNCAAHGHRWWEFDVTYATIRILEMLGLATDVVKYPLEKARPAKN